MTTPNDRSPAPKLSATDKELSAQRSDDLSLLHRNITAAIKKIRSSSTYHPPRAAETVAILGLWPKKAQRPALLEVIPRGTSALPLRMALRYRALRQQVDNKWVKVRIGEWDKETDRLITVPRADEAWATMLLAGNIACEVFEMECWSGPELDRHGLRIDFSDILADIGTAMLKSAEIALELGELPDEDGTTETEHARHMIGRQLRALDTVRDAVQAQIVALLTYRNRLAAVDRQTETVRRAEQARSVSDRTADLLGLVGSAETSENELIHASRSVADLAEARSLALAEVRGDYLNVLVEKAAKDSPAPPSPRTATVTKVRASLQGLLDEWADYVNNPEQYYLTMPTLHDITGTVPTTVAYQRALADLVAAVDELHDDSPADVVAAASTLADTAWERWHDAVKHAGEVGLDDRSTEERTALARLNKLVHRLQSSPASDPELQSIKARIQSCLDKISTVSVSWATIAALPGIEPAVRLQLPRGSEPA